MVSIPHRWHIYKDFCLLFLFFSLTYIRLLRDKGYSANTCINISLRQVCGTNYLWVFSPYSYSCFGKLEITYIITYNFFFSVNVLCRKDPENVRKRKCQNLIFTDSSHTQYILFRMLQLFLFFLIITPETLSVLFDVLPESRTTFICFLYTSSKTKATKCSPNCQ